DAVALAPEGQAGPCRELASPDARVQEVYAGSFELGAGDEATIGPGTNGPQAEKQIPDDTRRCLRIGTGFAALDGSLRKGLAERLEAVDPHRLPRASSLARLAARAWQRGEAVAPEQVEPAYLRNQVALTLSEQQALRDRRAGPGA